MLRECQGKGKNWRGQLWGVLHANWNGEARVQGQNARVQGGGKFCAQDTHGMRSLGQIRLTTLNIRSGRAGGMEAVLRALRQGNVDVGVLQTMKSTEMIHVRQR